MKENANPTVYSIENTTRFETSEDILIGTKFIRRFNCYENERRSCRASLDVHDSTPLFGYINTAEERSVYLALKNSCSLYEQQQQNPLNEEPTNDPVSIIRQVGMFNSNPALNSSLRVTFKPSVIRHIDNERDHKECRRSDSDNNYDTKRRDVVVKDEIFDIIRNIQDPEHPLTLEQLNVVNRDHIEVIDAFANKNTICDNNLPINGDIAQTYSTVDVRFTPTIPHCSMATLIGLCIRVKLLRSLPPRFQVTVRINPGTHASENAVNKQLGDKERVHAAIENKHLLGVVNRCIENGMKS